MGSTQKNQVLSKTEQEDPVPGYIKWAHLTSSVGDPKLPASICFLLRVITLTDSVISFNDTKRLTNTLPAVISTVSHLSKRKVEELHYRQILYVFGAIYSYRRSLFKDRRLLIIDKVSIDNRVMFCEARAKEWVRKQFCEHANTNVSSDANYIQAIDSLISTDTTFQNNILAIPALPFLEEESILSEVLVSPKDTPSVPPPVKSIHPRAVSILERIQARENQRRESFIKLEQEKDKEKEKVFHSIAMLAITENRRSFEKQLLQRRITTLNMGIISIDDVIKLPVAQACISTKVVDGKEYIIINLEKYKNSQTNSHSLGKESRL